MSGLNPSNSPWNVTSGITALATTTATAVQAAVASKRHFLTDLHIFNNSATVATLVSILDNTTVLWTGFLPATSATLQIQPIIAQFSTPLIGTANTQLNIKAGTTGASIYWNATGFDAP